MSTRFASLFQVCVFSLGLIVIFIGVLFLWLPVQQPATIPLTSLDSTITTTIQNDSLSNRQSQVKTTAVKNYKKAIADTIGTCDDCTKLRYDQAYKYISLGLLVIFLLFLLPFLQDFNLLGVFSGKFKERYDKLITLNNKVEEATATALASERPNLTEKAPPLETREGMVPTRPVIAYADDPQKGRWGEKNERNGRKLIATVSPDPMSSQLFSIHLRVVSTDPAKPLKGYVIFHLHNTFPNPQPRIFVKEGEANLTLKAWGAFTVGVEADQGVTRLEQDLAKLPGAPELFTSR